MIAIFNPKRIGYDLIPCQPGAGHAGDRPVKICGNEKNSERGKIPGFRANWVIGTYLGCGGQARDREGPGSESGRAIVGQITENWLGSADVEGSMPNKNFPRTLSGKKLSRKNFPRTLIPLRPPSRERVVASNPLPLRGDSSVPG
jgi:hypothetical protein